MIYTSARWADEAHTQVIGWDAEGALETVAYDHTVFRLPEHGPMGFEAAGGVIGPYQVDIARNIIGAPVTLFGGPTLKEIFNGH